MFIRFEVGNYRSFRDIQGFTMEAAPMRSNDRGMEEGNVFKTPPLRLLKAKAIFGSNASGKSNIIKAIDAFYNMVDRSVIQEGLAEEIWNDRFQLLTDREEPPIFFQYTFLHEGLIYRYGFHILDGKVAYEWLFAVMDDEEKEFFMRTPERLEVHEEHLNGFKSFTKRALEAGNELYRHDSLLLTAGALNANNFLTAIRNEIKRMILVDGVIDYLGVQYAMDQFIHGTDEKRKEIVDFLAAADTGIEDLVIKDVPSNVLKPFASTIDNRFKEMKREKELALFSVHSRYYEDGELKDKIMAPFREWESQGTKKLFGVGTLLLTSLEEGRSFIIDEFDSSFHPNLKLKIIRMFLNPKTNRKNAQVIFVSRDTGILNRGELRWDQICVVEKDKYGISKFGNLDKYKESEWMVSEMEHL